MGYRDYQQLNEDLRNYQYILNRPILTVLQGLINPPPFTDIGPFFDKAEFEAGVDQDINFEIKLPYQTLIEDELELHLHFVQTSASAGDVVWEVSYSILDVLSQDVTALVPTVVTQTMTPVNNPNELQNTLSLSPYSLKIPVSTLLPNGMISGTLSRLGTDGSDTNTSSMVLMYIEPVLLVT